MEENIKILENYLHTLKKFSGEEIIKSEKIIKFIEYKEIKAIENLIKGYRELGRLYKSEKEMKIRYVGYYQDLLLKENCIPKSKIKEKIEELEEERKKKDEENTIDVFYDQIDITHIIEVLQELLGDE